MVRDGGDISFKSGANDGLLAAPCGDAPFRVWRNLLISLAVFLAAFVLAMNPDTFDRPLTSFVNGLAGRSVIFDRLVFAMFSSNSFSGGILVALLWSRWFEENEDNEVENRSAILVGIFALGLAGAVSRMLQHSLPTHPRPYYDPELSFKLPIGFGQPLNTWNSFPSDHVVVFAGLAVLLYVVRSRFALYAIVWTTIVELARWYTGAHYLSDLIGGAALASMTIWGASALTSLGEPLIKWQQKSPSLFYMCAFFVCFQVVTLGGDLRSLASILWRSP